MWGPSAHLGDLHITAAQEPNYRDFPLIILCRFKSRKGLSLAKSSRLQPGVHEVWTSLRDRTLTVPYARHMLGRMWSETMQ